MKLLVLKNNIPNNINLPLQKVQELCKSVGLTLDIIIKETTRNFTSVPIPQSPLNAYSNAYMISTQEILDEERKYGDFNGVLLCFDWSKYITKPMPPTENGWVMAIPWQWCGDNPFYPDVFVEYTLHEISHTLAWESQKIDLTHGKYENPQFVQKTNIDYYLHLISQYKTMPIYKYFKESEVIGLKPELVQLLDKAREYAGIPFKITSGFRTKIQNDLVGGISDSSHLLGLGCDILAETPEKRFKVINGALKAGFKRIGVYEKHIHLDCKSFPQPALWTSEKD